MFISYKQIFKISGRKGRFIRKNIDISDYIRPICLPFGTSANQYNEAQRLYMSGIIGKREIYLKKNEFGLYPMELNVHKRSYEVRMILPTESNCHDWIIFENKQMLKMERCNYYRVTHLIILTIVY